MRNNELVGYLYNRVNGFFAKMVMNNWERGEGVRGTNNIKSSYGNLSGVK